MEPHPFQTPRATPLGAWARSEAVTLRVTASDARRIVRALEQSSVSLGGSPSGAQLAGTYIRLASAVRRQAEVVTFDSSPGARQVARG